MTFAELKAHIHNCLQPLYPKSEINSFYFILLEHYVNYTTADVLANADTLLTDDIKTSDYRITNSQTHTIHFGRN